MCFGVCLNQPHFRISIQHIPESMYFFLSPRVHLPLLKIRDPSGEGLEKKGVRKILRLLIKIVP